MSFMKLNTESLLKWNSGVSNNKVPHLKKVLDRGYGLVI